MTATNGSLPMHKGQVNKSELIRRVILRSPAGTQVIATDVIGKVKREYGVSVRGSDVDNVRSVLRRNPEKWAKAHAASNGVPGTPAAIAPLPEPKTSAVELIKLTRLAIEAAGSKEALKELVGVL